MVAYVGLEVQIHGLEKTGQTWREIQDRVQVALDQEFGEDVDILIEVTEHA